MEDGRLDQGLVFGDLEDRCSKDASRWARSCAEWMALPFSLLTSSSSPGGPVERAAGWTVRPVTPTGVLGLISIRGTDWGTGEALTVDGMLLAVGKGLCGSDEPLPSNRVSDVDPAVVAPRPASLTVNLTRFALLGIAAFLSLP